jgi:four helix bundle protein
MITSYKDLNVWQKAIDLTVEVYRLVKILPKEEMYALSNQIRRAVVSIPANIAEGKNRGSVKEYVHFLTIARGSKAELETHLYVCVKVEYLSESDLTQVTKMMDDIGKMLNSLISKLKTKKTIQMTESEKEQSTSRHNLISTTYNHSPKTISQAHESRKELYKNEHDSTPINHNSPPITIKGTI